MLSHNIRHPQERVRASLRLMLAFLLALVSAACTLAPSTSNTIPAPPSGSIPPSVYVGAAGQLIALDELHGTQRWAATTSQSLLYTDPPIIVGDTIYVSSSNDLYAFRATHGAHLWHDNGDYVYDTSAVSGGELFGISSPNGPVYAIDARTGALRWQHPASWVISTSSPLVDGGTVYASGETVTTSGPPITTMILEALDARSGAFRWLRHLGGSAGISWLYLVSGNGILYAGEGDGQVFALREADGTLLWSYYAGQAPLSGPLRLTLSGRFLYVASGNAAVIALDAASGAVRWRVLAHDSIIGPVVVAGGIVYFDASDDHVYALDAADGSLIWHSHAGDLLQEPLTITGGMVYGSSFDGSIYALSAADGSLRWHARTGAEIFDPAVVANGTVYAMSSDHYLYAWNAANGSLRWRALVGTRLDPAPPFIVSP